ncbi:MAG: hypothetical protein M3011_11185 [Actinomycetota bacterium]|nr:hypothetical protein [Actinomycetota bacterium]
MLLAVLFPVMSPQGTVSSDEGAYALQAKALQHGSWAYDYKAAPLDPDGHAFPVVLSNRHGDQYYAYIQHPSYPVLLNGVSALVGFTLGLHLLALLGTLGIAVSAWLMAGEIDPRFARAAFWVAAVSPALVNGYLVWAHTLAAAIAGMTLVLLVRTVRRGPAGRRTVVMAAGLAAGVLLRSEGLLFASVVAVVAAAVAWRRPADACGDVSPPGICVRAASAAVALAGLACPAVAAALLERLWTRHIVGGGYDNLHDRAAGTPWLPGRLSAAWHDLLQGSYTGSGRMLAPFALFAFVGFGALALRRWRDDSVVALWIGAAVAVGLAAVQFVVYPLEPISGLFAAWPVALLGLVLVRWRREGPVVPILGATAGLFALLVLSSEYPDGGGVEWGGRFYFPLLVPLAVLAVVGLAGRLAEAPSAGRYVATGLLASVALSGGLLGVASGARMRADAAGLAAAVARHPSPVTVTTVPALPRVVWSTDQNLSWMLTDSAGLRDLLMDLRSRGLTEVAVVTWRPGPGLAASNAGFSSTKEVSEPALAAHDLGLFVLRS